MNNIEHLTWTQSVPLRDGSWTPGFRYEGANYDRFRLPEENELRQWTVADLGTLDGFWAVEAKRKGATVCAFDYMDRPTARITLAEWGIPYVPGADLNVPIAWPHQFTLVLFYGVLYHLRNPMQGLINAFNLVEVPGTLIVESACNTDECAKIPAEVPAIWLPPNGFANDRSNYCMPNKEGLRQLCRNLDGVTLEDEIYMNGRMTIVCRKN